MVEVVKKVKLDELKKERREAFGESPEADGDVRTLAARWEADGHRHRDYAECVSLFTEEEFDEEFTVDGERYAMWYLRELKRSGQTPITHHNVWVKESDVGPGDRSGHEHRCLSEMLEAGATSD